MRNAPLRDLTHDLILPTMLFAALGGMTWAVRGSSGFGATAGCIFAGVAWGAAWWFIARDTSGEQSRRYSSGWIVLAVTVGLGVAGARGWMQWPSFFEGKLQTDAAKNEFVPIPTIYGFVWLFIAGVPWAGLGACLLAWCGSLRETRVWHWAIRIACGICGMLLARYLFNHYPQYFLPLYDSLESRYSDLEANPNLRRLMNDSGAAIAHLGAYLGFLLYEVGRRDWKNVVLIAAVGLINGAGWQFCQNWKWADDVWPTANFNWWRCWESSGGISIGIAYGIAYFLVNRQMSDPERKMLNSRRAIAGPNFEWLLVFCGLTALFDTFLRYQLAGWGPYYFSIVIIFGVAYYLKYRGTPLIEPLSEAENVGRGWNVEWGALCLGTAMLAGQFFQGRQAILLRSNYYMGVIALGAVYFLIRRRHFEKENSLTMPQHCDPILERFGLYVGVFLGLGLSIRNGLKGWFNIYMGDERYWSAVLWQVLGPVFIVVLTAIAAWILFRPLPRNFRGDPFPHAYAIVWLVMIVQNVLAQLVTGPPTAWNEVAFNIYYGLLFAVTAAIVIHYRCMKAWRATL
ncbi:MAG: hypothetical protein WD648_16280 [Planctomycetaceae bacterium]